MSDIGRSVTSLSPLFISYSCVSNVSNLSGATFSMFGVAWGECSAWPDTNVRGERGVIIVRDSAMRTFGAHFAVRRAVCAGGKGCGRMNRRWIRATCLAFSTYARAPEARRHGFYSISCPGLP